MNKTNGNKRNVSKGGVDYYPTPSWAIDALLEKEKFNGTIYEPCCGEGYMSKALISHNYKVISSDIENYGYGTPNVDAKLLVGPCENIITNPPYNIAEDLLQHFFTIYENKIAMLLRLSFLESRKRYPLFQKHKPKVVYVFPERLSLCAGGETVKGGGTISYGWFIWEKNYSGETKLDWLSLGFKNKK